MRNADRPTIVGFGAACLDYVAVAPKVDGAGYSRMRSLTTSGGGITATACCTAARLGANVTFLGRVGVDEIGNRIIADLVAENVDINRLIRIPGGKSLLSWIIVDPETGERQIYSRRDYDVDCRIEMIDLTALIGADALLVDDHWPDGARYVVAAAKSAGVPIICDIRLGPENYDLIEIVDYSVISEAYAMELVPAGSGYREALEAMRNIGAKTAVITCGNKGTHYMDTSGYGYQDAFEVNVEDSTGAGDVFHGAFAIGVAKGWALENTVRFASSVAAIKCTKPGGRAGIPTFDQAMTFIRERGFGAERNGAWNSNV